MKKMFIFIVAITLFASCSRNEEIIAISKAFFNTLSDTTYAHPNDYYPSYKYLNIEAKSDMVEIEESKIIKQSDTTIVKCFNNYTTPEGVFKQDSVILFLITNEQEQYYICNSRGLVTLDEDLKEFGLATGALNKTILNDIQLSERYEQIKKMYFNEYLETHLMLLKNVKIQDWSWETSSYSGESHGEGKVVNNLDFAIDGIKYELTYYDYRGNFMAQDDGNISKKLYPNEKYNFTFWSSNAKYPSTANLRLVFPDRLIYKIIKEQSYTGNEFNEYVNSIK